MNESKTNHQPEYVEIDLVDLFQKILANWYIVLIAMLVCAGTSYYVTKNFIVPTYEAKTSIFIGKEENGFGQIDLSTINAGNKLVTDYRELIRTNNVLNAVIQTLALETDPATLKEKINIEIANDSRFIYTTVEDPSPQMAVAIANALSDILKLKVEEIIKVDNVTVVDYATLPENPIRPSTAKNTAIAGILGIMVALGIIFINLMLNTGIEKDEDIENAIGIPVIAVIPKFKGEVR